MMRRQSMKTPQKTKAQKAKGSPVAVNTDAKFLKKANPKAEDIKEKITKNAAILKNKLPKKKSAQKATKNKKEVEEDIAVGDEDLNGDAEIKGLGEDNIDEEIEMPDEEEDFDEEDEDSMEAENDDEVDDDNDGDEEEENDDDNQSDGGEVQPDKNAMKTKASKPKVGKIPKDYALDKIVQIKNIPKNCKSADIIELFAEYGPIHGIRIMGGKQTSFAELAFKTTEAAAKAAAASGNIVTHDSALTVEIKKNIAKFAGKQDKKTNVDREGEDRRVYVRNLNLNTDKDDLVNLFKSCGEIVKIEMAQRSKSASAVVEFVNKESKPKALEKHNATLNDTNISVYESYDWKSKAANKRDPEHTITLRNKQKIDCVDSDKLTSCFTDCGEIVNMELICGKNILAFITFKTEDAAAKAMDLNGTTKNGIELEIEKYNPGSRKVSIHVSNLSKGVTQEDLEHLFSTCGEISSIVLKTGYAVIHFATPEAYCKSFLLTEVNMKGQIIFVEPFSTKKRFVMNQSNRKRKFSGPHPKQNGFKKAKRNF